MTSGRQRVVRLALQAAGNARWENYPPLRVRTINIGLGVVAAVNPRPDLACLLRFALPLQPFEGTSIDVQARVSHSVLSGQEDGFKIGLQFVHLPVSAAAAIEQYLRMKRLQQVALVAPA